MSNSPEVDIQAEIDRFFDPASIPTAHPPQAVILAGGVGTGKTRLRRERYSQGYVVLDAAEIFLSLCRGRYLDFPGPVEESMDLIGLGVARRIFREKRNFVVELICADPEPTKALIDALVGTDYHCDFVHVKLDVQTAWEHNVNRGPNNISAYYTEPFHVRWILTNASGNH